MDENNRVVRRRAAVRELIEVCGPRENLFAVLKAFRDQGFLRPPGELEDDTLIDLTDECILRGWDKLPGTNNEKGWLQQEVETRDFYLELKRRTAALT